MHRREQGQSLIEFALTLALLLLIFLGIFDLGRAFNAYMVVTNAAREGASYGAMHPDDLPGIVTRAISETEGSAITITDVKRETSFAKGTPITVTVTYTFSLFSFVVPGVQTIRLQRSAVMAIY